MELIRTLLQEADDKVTELMLKLRKGSSLSAKQLAQIATTLGWTVKESVVPFAPKHLNNVEWLLSALGFGHGDFHVFGDAAQQRFSAKSMEAIEKVHAAAKKLEVKTLPETVKKPGQVILTKVSNPIKSDASHEPFEFTARVYISAKVMTFKAPRGGEETIVWEPGHTSYLPYEFVRTDLFKELKSQAIEKLGLGTIDDERATKKTAAAEARAGEYSGHCQICGRPQKLRKAGSKYVMVLHGYTRPGHGYLIGNCYGVGYQPYEKAYDACEKYIGVLEDGIKASKKYIADLKSGKTTSLRAVPRNSRDGRPVTITSSDAGWEAAKADRVWAIERDVKYMKQDQDVMRERVKAWKEVKLKFEE